MLGDRRQAELFYAESWALAHMLLLSKDYGPGHNDCLKMFLEGAASENIFDAIYGKSIAQVQEDLKAYLGAGRFPSVTSPMASGAVAAIADPGPATSLELEVALANISIGTGKNDEARRILEPLSREYPSSWEVEEALGFLCWYGADHVNARAHFGRAVENGMTNPQTYMYYVGLLGEVRTPDAMLMPLVEKALQLQPGNNKACLKLAALYLRARRYEDVIGLVRTPGIRLDEAFQAHLLLASAHLGLGDIESARRAVNEAAPCARTQSEISEIERISRSVAARQETGGNRLPPA